MVGKHVSTGYSSNNVDQESLFCGKNVLLHEVLNQVAIFRYYSQLEESSIASLKIAS